MKSLVAALLVIALAAAAAACAAPEPAPRAPEVPRPAPSPPQRPEMDELQESRADPAPSRTVPQRYETRRIGPEQASAHRAWVGRPIDLDVKDADIHDVLRLLSEVGRANIVVSDEVVGRVTVRMKQVPWDQALDVVARAKGFAVERDGAVLLVTRAAPRPTP